MSECTLVKKKNQPIMLTLSPDTRTLLVSQDTAKRGLDQFYKEHFPAAKPPEFSVMHATSTLKIIHCHIATTDPWFDWSHFRVSYEIKHCTDELLGKQRAAFGCAQWLISRIDSRCVLKQEQEHTQTPQQMPSFAPPPVAPTNGLSESKEILDKMQCSLNELMQMATKLSSRMDGMDRKLDQIQNSQSQTAFQSLADAMGDAK